MTRTHIASMPFLLLLLAVGSAGAAAAAEQSFVETFPLQPDGRVSIDNVNGDVSIEGWANAEVKVEYTKRARTSSGLDRMEVRIDASASRIHVETEYAKSDDGWFGWGDSGGEVDFRLWVPAKARIDGVDLVNGRLEISGVEGDVAAEMVNGDVVAKGLRGDVEIETVNGDVEVEMPALEPDRRVRIDSVNGSIELVFPAGVGADIEASTVHGRISNDFGLEVERGRYVGRSMKGRVGGGGARVELENVNGGIRVVSH